MSKPFDWLGLMTNNFISEHFQHEPLLFAMIRGAELSSGHRLGTCSFCGTLTRLFLCGGSCCGEHAYCRRKCQKKHWSHHKECKQVRAEVDSKKPKLLSRLKIIHVDERGNGRNQMSLSYSHFKLGSFVPVFERMYQCICVRTNVSNSSVKGGHFFRLSIIQMQ